MTMKRSEAIQDRFKGTNYCLTAQFEPVAPLLFNYSFEMMEILSQNELLSELQPETRNWVERCLKKEFEKRQEAIKTLKEQQQVLKVQLNSISEQLNSITTEIQILTS